MKKFLISLSTIVGIVIIYLIFVFVGNAGKVVSKTLDADNVIYNYEYFYNKYESYNSINKKIDNAGESLTDFIASLPDNKEDWMYEDRQILAQKRSILRGLEAQKADIIKDYNSHSDMKNRSLFKDNNLPDKLY